MRMRLPLKLVFAALFVAALAAPRVASAQGFGVKGGINIATLHPNSDASDFGFEADSLTGFVVGIFGPPKKASTFEFQTDVLYSQEGAKDPGSDEKLKLSYIRVPIRAGFTVSGSSATKVRVLVGPSLAFLLKADDTDGTTVSVTDEFKRYDVGVAAGVQAEISRLVVDVGYTWGFISIFKDTTGNAKVMNRTITATVGIRFRQ